MLLETQVELQAATFESRKEAANTARALEARALTAVQRAHRPAFHELQPTPKREIVLVEELGGLRVELSHLSI